MANITITTLNQALSVRDYNIRMGEYNRNYVAFVNACKERATTIVNNMLQTIANGIADRYVLILHEEIYQFAAWDIIMSNSAVRRALDFPKPPMAPTKPDFMNDNPENLCVKKPISYSWPYILEALANAGFYADRLCVDDSMLVFIDISTSPIKVKA